MVRLKSGQGSGQRQTSKNRAAPDSKSSKVTPEAFKQILRVFDVASLGFGVIWAMVYLTVKLWTGPSWIIIVEGFITVFTFGCALYMLLRVAEYMLLRVAERFQ